MYFRLKFQITVASTDHLKNETISPLASNTQKQGEWSDDRFESKNNEKVFLI